MRFDCDRSLKFRSSRRIQWSKTQHQLSVWVMRSWFRNHGTRNLCVLSVFNRFRTTQSSSGAMSSSHWFRCGHIKRTVLVCTSCTHHTSQWSASQREWWRDQDQRSEEGNVCHSYGGHAHHIPHCRRRSQSHHRSRCSTSKFNSVPLVSDRQGLSSAEESESNSSLSQASLLCFRSCSFRICQEFNTQVGWSSVHHLRSSINESDHCRDRLRTQFRG